MMPTQVLVRQRRGVGGRDRGPADTGHTDGACSAVDEADQPASPARPAQQSPLRAARAGPWFRGCSARDRARGTNCSRQHAS